MIDQLQEKHFVQLAHLVEDHTGIRLPPAKRIMVEGRLRKRMRILGLNRLEEYGNVIFEHGKLDEEFVHLVDCVTTNKTDFFREPDHFEFMREQAIPKLLATRRTTDARIKLWSAAASIGAEAYTIAMVLEDMFCAGGHPSYSILGTDICTDVLQQARRAIYPAAMMDPVPAEFRQRFVMNAVRKGRAEVRIVPELRQRVRFQHLNLMDDSYAVDRDVDIIFCRNILIYFDKARQNAVLQRLCGHLRMGGYLILGHSESLAGGEQMSMRPVAPTVFVKAA